MANTLTIEMQGPIGTNAYLKVIKIVGDGSTTTVITGFVKIYSAFLIDVDDAPSSNLCTWSGGTVTLAEAISSTKIRYLYVFGC